MSEPRHKHDCDQCDYLGQYEGADLYFCGKSLPTVIARYSDEPSDYTSGLEIAKTGLNSALWAAYQEALKRGFIKED